MRMEVNIIMRTQPGGLAMSAHTRSWAKTFVGNAGTLPKVNQARYQVCTTVSYRTPWGTNEMIYSNGPEKILSKDSFF